MGNTIDGIGSSNGNHGLDEPKTGSRREGETVSVTASIAREVFGVVRFPYDLATYAGRNVGLVLAGPTRRLTRRERHVAFEATGSATARIVSRLVFGAVVAGLIAMCALAPDEFSIAAMLMILGWLPAFLLMIPSALGVRTAIYLGDDWLTIERTGRRAVTHRLDEVEGAELVFEASGPAVGLRLTGAPTITPIRLGVGFADVQAIVAELQSRIAARRFSYRVAAQTFAPEPLGFDALDDESEHSRIGMRRSA